MNHAFIVPLLAVCWLLVLALAPGEAAADRLAIVFQAEVSLKGPQVLLGDIARIEPTGPAAEAAGRLPVAAAPAPGQSKEISAGLVIAGLRHRPETAEADWQGSPSILVRRAANRLTREQLQQIITEYLREQRPQLPKAEIRFSALRAPEELFLPPGDLSWRVSPSQPGILGSNSFTIALFVDGEPSGQCVVRGRLEALAEVATATTILHKGTALSEANLRLQQQDISGMHGSFSELEQLFGMQAARTITAGTAIEPTQVIAPALIREGEMVKIVARKGSLLLSAHGLARSDGRLGEKIQVKNISSNKMILCRVDGPGTVSVEF